MEDVLNISDLNVGFKVYGGEVHAVRHFSMSIHHGEVYALIGESGCGKSTIAHTICGLNNESSTNITAQTLNLCGIDIFHSSDAKMEKIREEYVSMIFQDSITSLNPTMKIGKQIVETLYRRKKMTPQECKNEALRLLKLVQIPDAELRYDQYPHQLSGGMKQRVLIAIAISTHPRLLIADEATTALDVTIQSQILQIIADIQKKEKTSVLLITHDFGVVANIADRVGVMYAGEIVEENRIYDIFENPQHPYTQSLMKCLPYLNEKGTLYHIAGEPPDLFTHVEGCSFSKRCPYCMQICLQEEPPCSKISDEHFVRCWRKHSTFIDYTKIKE